VSRTAPHGAGRGATRWLAPALLALPGAALVAVTGYQSVVMAAAWRARLGGRGRTPLPDTPRHRFLVLIPAHNEERLIGAALGSLAALEYPPALVSVHVVADNCDDATADIVRAHGVEVHERIAEDGGKGPALQWLLRRLRDRGEAHDGVVIIDADTSVSPNFLRVMDAKLASGEQAVQAYYAVRDASSSPAAAFRATALAARHYVRPLGRTQLGGSAGLHGNGMAFRAEVLAAHQWTNHLTEDIELELELILSGTRVGFAPDAVVEAEMPDTLEGSQTQHERWERGRLEMVQRYVPRLLGRARRARGRDRVACADAALDQLVPPLSVTVAGTVAWSGIALGAVVLGSRRARGALAVAVGLVVAQGAYVLSGLRMVGAPRALYVSLLGAPRYVLWKIGLWRKLFGRKDAVTWVRTERNAEALPAAAK
jgi:hypothetical protein